MPDGTAADEWLGNLVHLDRRLHASIDALLFERVLQCERVDDGRQHAHVVGGDAVHFARLLGHTTEEVSPANDDGDLEVDVFSRFLTYQNRCEYEQYLFVGDRKDRIRRTEQGWKLCRREIRIHQNVLLAKNLSIFF